MSQDYPWFAFYSGDWLAGTRGLSAIETGVYITLIASMYDAAAPLVRDDGRLSRLCGCSPRQFKSAVERLMAESKIIVIEGKIWNARVADEIQLRAAKSEKAKASSDARWRRNNEENQSIADANAFSEQCESDASHSHSHKEEEKNTQEGVPKEIVTASKPRRGTRIPGDFQPDASCQRVAENLLLTAQQSQAAFEKFSDYWKGVPGERGIKLDWQATFRNWLRNERNQFNGLSRTQRRSSIAHASKIVGDAIDAQLAAALEAEGRERRN